MSYIQQAEIDLLSQVQNVDLYLVLDIPYTEDIVAVQKSVKMNKFQNDQNYLFAYTILTNVRLKYIYDKYMYPKGELDRGFPETLETSITGFMSVMLYYTFDNLTHVSSFAQRPLGILGPLSYVKSQGIKSIFRGSEIFLLWAPVSLYLQKGLYLAIWNHPENLLTTLLTNNMNLRLKELFNIIVQLPKRSLIPQLVFKSFDIINIFKNLFYGMGYFILPDLAFLYYPKYVKSYFIKDLPDLQDDSTSYTLRGIYKKSREFIFSPKGIATSLALAAITNPIYVLKSNYFNQLLLNEDSRKSLYQLAQSLYQTHGIKIFFNGFIFNFFKQIITLFNVEIMSDPTYEEIEILAQVENQDVYKDYLGIEYTSDINSVQQKVNLVRLYTDQKYNLGYKILTNPRLKHFYDTSMYPHGKKESMMRADDTIYGILATFLRFTFENLNYACAYTFQPLSIVGSIRFVSSQGYMSMFRGRGLYLLQALVGGGSSSKIGRDLKPIVFYPFNLVFSLMASNPQATYQRVFKTIIALPKQSIFPQLIFKNIDPISIFTKLYYGGPMFILMNHALFHLKFKLKTAYIPDLPKNEYDTQGYTLRNIGKRSLQYINSPPGIIGSLFLATLLTPLTVLKAHYLNQLFLEPKDAKSLVQLAHLLYQSHGIKIFFNGFLFNFLSQIMQLYLF
ncbi:hypothetical protein DLAC_02591 [Tieghemostelium lacteum]|uniref:Transmembrane protein n=1 Tax=Tieghemostelium lacteum TaxID=361077 RepID=A0A152A2T6_TIELA|nr:hypothetical protein DLAC_02591 [Tieghemostelium lacteum]|eukprot:KYR00572.1 hypothetical protein DLAC_02591 [Tieghemostelium lacteum]